MRLWTTAFEICLAWTCLRLRYTQAHTLTHASLASGAREPNSHTTIIHSRTHLAHTHKQFMTRVHIYFNIHAHATYLTRTQIHSHLRAIISRAHFVFTLTFFFNSILMLNFMFSTVCEVSRRLRGQRTWVFSKLTAAAERARAAHSFAEW